MTAYYGNLPIFIYDLQAIIKDIATLCKFNNSSNYIVIDT